MWVGFAYSADDLDRTERLRLIPQVRRLLLPDRLCTGISTSSCLRLKHLHCVLGHAFLWSKTVPLALPHLYPANLPCRSWDMSSLRMTWANFFFSYTYIDTEPIESICLENVIYQNNSNINNTTTDNNANKTLQNFSNCYSGYLLSFLFSTFLFLFWNSSSQETSLWCNYCEIISVPK